MNKSASTPVGEVRGAPFIIQRTFPLPVCVALVFQKEQPLGACDLLLYVFADHTLGSLDEREFVRQAAFEKDTDTGMAHRIGGRDQSDVTPNLQVHEVAGLGQNEQFAGERQLDLTEFLAEIFDEHVVQPLIHFSGLLSNEFEAFVQSGRHLRRDQATRSQSFLDLRVLGCFAQFLVNFLASFRAVPQLAQHGDEKFFRGCDWHCLT